MKKVSRKFFITSGVFLALVMLVFLVVAFFLPTDQISQRMETELVKATGAEVSIGDTGVQWWPSLGVTLKNCKIQGKGSDLAEKTGSANELGEYSANLDRFVVQVALGPLLRKEVLVHAIQMHGLDFEAVLRGELFKVVGADLAVKDLQISMEAAKAAGQPKAEEGKLPVGEMIPEDLVLAFEGHAESFTAREFPLVGVDFYGDLDSRILTLESITAALGSGRLEGNLEIDYERDSNGILDFEAHAETVPAEVLLRRWASSLGEKLETALSGNVRGNCLLGPQEVIRRTLTLTGEMNSESGVLWAREWLGDIAPYLGKRQDLMDIRFDSLSHSLRLEKGRYVVENIEIDGLETHWQGNGSLGLDGTIDLGLKVKLPRGFTPELGQWSFLADTLRDKDGRINLDLHLSGMAAKPQVGLNLGTLQDAAGSNAGEAVKKGLGGLLDKWKNR